MKRVYRKFKKELTSTAFYNSKISSKMSWFYDTALPDLDTNNRTVDSNGGFFKVFDVKKIAQYLKVKNYQFLMEQPEEVYWPSFQSEFKIRYAQFLHDTPPPREFASYVLRDAGANTSKTSGMVLRVPTDDDKDARTNTPFLDLLKEFRSYDEMMDSDNFQTIVDLFRRNFSSLASNSYLKESSTNELPYLIALLSLQGVIDNPDQPDAETLTSLVQSVTGNLNSQAKQLSEIVLFFL
jgi:hypothetical protein